MNNETEHSRSTHECANCGSKLSLITSNEFVDKMTQENAKLRARVERLTHFIIAIEAMSNKYNTRTADGRNLRMCHVLAKDSQKDCEEKDIDSVGGAGSTVRPEDFQVTNELIERLWGKK